MHCYNIWASVGISGGMIARNWIFDDKVPITQCCSMVHDRVLTLVLSGGVEAFPTMYPMKPRVMGGRCYIMLP